MYFLRLGLRPWLPFVLVRLSVIGMWDQFGRYSGGGGMITGATRSKREDVEDGFLPCGSIVPSHSLRMSLLPSHE